MNICLVLTLGANLKGVDAMKHHWAIAVFYICATMQTAIAAELPCKMPGTGPKVDCLNPKVGVLEEKVGALEEKSKPAPVSISCVKSGGGSLCVAIEHNGTVSFWDGTSKTITTTRQLPPPVDGPVNVDCFETTCVAVDTAKHFWIGAVHSGSEFAKAP